jgi:hypothetical protein
VAEFGFCYLAEYIFDAEHNAKTCGGARHDFSQIFSA